MKNSLLCLTALLLAAALAACGSSFSGSRIGTDTQLLMEYEIFNTTDSQSLAMEAGDLVTIDVVSEAGQLAVHIQPQDDESIFDGAEAILLKDGSGACSVYRFPA